MHGILWDTSYFNISYQTNLVSNTGHSNIDNYAEISAPGPSTRLISARFTYVNPWMVIELEPYTRSSADGFPSSGGTGTYDLNNNHSIGIANKKTDMGFKQSQIILHYNGIGFGYGRMSHWWSPGFHSGLALTSNASSQETYALGTFQDLRLGRLAFGAQVIVMPYSSITNEQLYFSGLKAHMTYHSNPVITLGFHRTFLSGDFSNLSSITKAVDAWTLVDAAQLVVEPLFGQDKRNLSYTMPGTPGFDIWDEVLTGFIKLTFPKEHFEVYVDIASDDNRGNMTDLKAHWDHTLGYLLGFKKFFKIDNNRIFTGIEYLTTRVSNTFKSDFYRGSEPDNYYSKKFYDYFTYQGRRMGAHSGSSSDDLIFMIGIGTQKSMTLISYNKERHGIKSMTHPELKSELALTYRRTISKHHSTFITLEYEKIRNFSFIKDKLSESKLLWVGYSFSIR